MTLTAPVVFQSVPLETELRPAELVQRDWLTPGYVRLRFAGEALRSFHAPGADDHVRLFLAPPGSPLPVVGVRGRGVAQALGTPFPETVAPVPVQE